MRGDEDDGKADSPRGGEEMVPEKCGKEMMPAKTGPLHAVARSKRQNRE